MPTNRFFGDDMTLSIETQSNANALTVAKLRGVTIRAEAEHIEFFSADEVTFQDVKRREVVVIAEVEYAEFAESFAQYWLQGDDSTTSTTITNSSDATQYKITGEVDMTDHTESSGDESLKAVVENAHTEEALMFDSQEGEYLAHNATFRGSAITFTKEAVA